MYIEQGAPQFPGKRHLEATILLFPPHNRSFDVDNRVKPTLDALSKCGLWQDDRYVRKITVLSCPSVEGGAIVVTVAPLVNQYFGRVLEIIENFGLRILNTKKGTKK